ncbi:MAG: SufD family Fe-S cluster assembly protein [Planctomycetota bacterium]
MADLIEQLYESIGKSPHDVRGDERVARIEVHKNEVLGVHLVPGLEVDADETATGLDASITVTRGSVIEKPVQVCFGMMPETGLQEIVLDIRTEEDARAAIVAHCTFPFARDVTHTMEARIRVGPGSEYAYFERHVHGPEGGVLVIPKTTVTVEAGGRFSTEFELIKGRVGTIDLDLEATCKAGSVMDVTARIAGRGDDRIKLNEVGHLVGEGARGALTSHIAVRDTARAEILNTLTASAPFARGHVDCKEIVQDEAVARAVPTVEVNHPQAHVTHEAAIGSVDAKQLETLMSRGLDEDAASALIIQGLLS